MPAETDYSDWADSEGLAELEAWNDILDSDEEFYLPGRDGRNDELDIADLNDLDDSLASDD